MMGQGGSTSQGFGGQQGFGQQGQGVFGLPQNRTFPQFGPSQSNTRTPFGQAQQGPQMSGPFGSGGNFQSSSFQGGMQTPQNTQGLNQGQVNAGVYTRPDGTISFSGGPASPMSSMTAGFLGMGSPQTNFQNNSFGPPPPSYPGGQTEGFGPQPPSFGGADPMGSAMQLDARLLPDGTAVGRNDPRFFAPSGGMGAGGAAGSYDDWGIWREPLGAGGPRGITGAAAQFDPWAQSRAMAQQQADFSGANPMQRPGTMQAQPKPMQVMPTAPAQPFPAAPQFDMFGRQTLGSLRGY